MARYQPMHTIRNFDAISIRLASPEKIKGWAKSPNPNSFSTGEVKKPETINYRTFRPEKDGLFCEAIFGPTKDWECSCGKYKRIKYKDVVCERCGVEVTVSKVRRERMGYIQLATPVCHIWFFKSVPSHLGLLLDLSLKELERVLYFEAYLVLDPGDSPLDFKDRLTDEQYHELLDRGYHFRAEMGAAAVKEVLENMNLEHEEAQLEIELAQTNSKQKAKKIRKRLKLIRGLRKSGNRPEWMILDVIPVIPPELRPLVALDGGRFATSDLNDLYRRVINRNNRLKRLADLKAPEVIIRNEKRMLQEAVDALIENGKHGRVVKGPGNRALKSLSDMLKGKPGRFRQNLLGKRVDYSGRSVIVVGPELKLNQCGLPKKMALELFKPFIIRKLQDRNYAPTIKSAKRMTERVDDQVWEVLEEVIQEHPVLLNRAPTLHRLGIQAFQPHLVEGEAIRIHPLVCKAFNADFDGDQMAVHVPLSPEARIEAQVLMPAIRNILKPAHGQPVAVPELDMVLGCNYLTKEIRSTTGFKPGLGGHIRVSEDNRVDEDEKPDPLYFSNPEAVVYAYDAGHIQLHDWVVVRIRHEGTTALLKTTPGRVLFNEVLPKEMLFDCEDVHGNTVRLPFLNEEMTTKKLRALVSTCFHVLGNRKAVELLQDLKNIGFKFATISGVSLAVTDFAVPMDKEALQQEAIETVAKIEQDYQAGKMSPGERYNQIVEVWGNLTTKVQENLLATLQKNTLEQRPALTDGIAPTPGASGLPVLSDGRGMASEIYEEGFNPVYIMANSGARSKMEPMRQISGMRGLMAKPDGSIIETPIFASFREGLTVLEYFISTHGARKGLADTAIKTASSGYLTRKLVDVAQDVVITMEDCGTMHGILKTAMEADEENVPLSALIEGRAALEDVLDPVTDEVIVPAQQMIGPNEARAIDEAGVPEVRVRSPLTCESPWGVCQKCYGMDLTNLRPVDIGEAIGIIAAQSIGEPGTQLTMRTFHTGGAVSETTVAESSIEARAREGTIIFRNLETTVRPNGDVIALRNGSLVIMGEDGRERERRRVPAGAVLHVREGDQVHRGMPLYSFAADHVPILAKVEGTAHLKDVILGNTLEEVIDGETGKSERIITDYRESMPRVVVQDDTTGDVLESYALPAGARLSVTEGAPVVPGDTLARMPRETAKTSDIVTGLPRVTELFEARKPKDHATISEISGTVSFQGMSRGMQVIRITPEEGPHKDYKIPLGKFIIVQEGDFVEAGDPLTDGSLDPHDILAVKGREEVQRYLVKAVKEVYGRAGENINDKHIEVIIRQMMKKVRITDPGDTEFLEGDEITLNTFRAANRKIERQRVEQTVPVSIDDAAQFIGNPLAENIELDTGVLAREGDELTEALIEDLRGHGVKDLMVTVSRQGRAAEAEPILQGITKAALSTDSFISAASFQQTTNVLTKAAALGKRDSLRGLKENVIMGRLIPAGTGTPQHRRIRVEARPLPVSESALTPSTDDD